MVRAPIKITDMARMKKTADNPPKNIREMTIERSKAKNWEEARHEWEFYRYYDCEGIRVICPGCGPSNSVRHLSVLRNIHNHNLLAVSNSCAKLYFDEEQGIKIQRAVQQIKKELDGEAITAYLKEIEIPSRMHKPQPKYIIRSNSMNKEALTYLVDNNIIHPNDKEYYELAGRQIKNENCIILRKKINTRLLVFTDYEYKEIIEMFHVVFQWINETKDNGLTQYIRDEWEKFLDGEIWKTSNYKKNIRRDLYSIIRNEKIDINEYLKKEKKPFSNQDITQLWLNFNGKYISDSRYQQLKKKKEMEKKEKQSTGLYEKYETAIQTIINNEYWKSTFWQQNCIDREPIVESTFSKFEKEEILRLEKVPLVKLFRNHVLSDVEKFMYNWLIYVMGYEEFAELYESSKLVAFFGLSYQYPRLGSLYYYENFHDLFKQATVADLTKIINQICNFKNPPIKPKDRLSDFVNILHIDGYTISYDDLTNSANIISGANRNPDFKLKNKMLDGLEALPHDPIEEIEQMVLLLEKEEEERLEAERKYAVLEKNGIDIDEMHGSDDTEKYGENLHRIHDTIIHGFIPYLLDILEENIVRYRYSKDDFISDTKGKKTNISEGILPFTPENCIVCLEEEMTLNDCFIVLRTIYQRKNSPQKTTMLRELNRIFRKIDLRVKYSKTFNKFIFIPEWNYPLDEIIL